MVRNAGKFGKPKRGGKKQFTHNLDQTDKVGMWDEDVNRSESEEESSEDDSKESTPASVSEFESESKIKKEQVKKGKEEASTEDDLIKLERNHDSARQTRSDKKKVKSKRNKNDNNNSDNSDSVEEKNDKDLENLNRATQKSLKFSEISKVEVGTPNRKEREAAEKKAAQERYWKLHQAGRTDEAKNDLARLAKIRQERERAAALRKTELEAKTKESAERAAVSGRKKK